MDESHRYRADAGMAAINDLKPVLGLELTATPQVERGKKTEPFQNVIYQYPLSAAMGDGFVKEPAVATRENFNASNYTEEGLEHIKLEDGIRIHENTRVDLEIYGRDNCLPIVKPFMLVVAQDTEHADRLQRLMESKDFFDGVYFGKVITIHSKKTKRSEGDDIVQQLLTVENPLNPIEVVIHVNMLKEGWDVTNLYTIVPLRAANSKTLVEQSIGRGLRLPYGKRVGVPAIDRLTIVSHDRFQDIIDHANDPDSIIRKGVIIGKDIPVSGKKVMCVEPVFKSFLSGKGDEGGLSGVVKKNNDSQEMGAQETLTVFKGEEEQKIAQATFEVIKDYEKLKGSYELQKPEIQQEIVKKIKEKITPNQIEFDFGEKPDIAGVVGKATGLYIEMSIDIPKIVVLPKGNVRCGYKDFNLDLSGINLQPVSQDILIQHLHDRQRHTLQGGSALVEEKRLEDYLVRELIAFDDISYDDHSHILYKLASQMVNHLLG